MGGGFAEIDTYDLTASGTDTLDELTLQMNADAPTLISISVLGPFSGGDSSSLLINQSATAVPGVGATLLADLP